MRVTVLGCGRWGTFLGWYSHSIGYKVTIWGRKNSENFLQLKQEHENDYLIISEEIKLSNSLENSVATADVIIISICAQQFRNLAKQLANFNLQNKTIILCMKGLEKVSGYRLSEILREEIENSCNIAVWVGPGHVQDFYKGIPNCMIVGSNSESVAKNIMQKFSSELIRLYYSSDLLGIEIGAAAKNVIGIAAGMLDGLNYSSLKGALMARGAYEIASLVKKIGGQELTVFGLSHLGDYEATLFSPHSHNRKFGEYFVQQKQFGKLAEGVFTVKALLQLSKKYDVELPICKAIDNIITQKTNPKDMLLELFLRPLKQEF